VNTLAIDGKFLSCSVNAGFILALPLHHGDLELDSVGVSMKSYLKLCCYFGSVVITGGPISKIKIPVQELLLKM